MNSIWQPYDFSSHPTLSNTLRDWLLDKGSFVVRLKNHGALNPKIQILRQAWASPYPDESKLLGIDFRSYAWIREVLITSEKNCWMYARAIFPRQTLTGQHLQLLHLKTRSLGSVLFKDPSLERSEFEISCLRAGSPWYEKVTQKTSVNTESLWARRSAFYLKHKQILLTEVFLPDIEKLNY